MLPVPAVCDMLCTRVQATFAQLRGIAHTDAGTVAHSYHSAFWEHVTRHFYEDLRAAETTVDKCIVRTGLCIECDEELHKTFQAEFAAAAAGDAVAARAACLELVQQRMLLWA